MIEDAGVGAALEEALADAKGYLRIEGDQEDALIAGLIATAVSVAEQFLARALILRTFSETRTAASNWQRLGRTPVSAILSVEGVPAEGAAFALPVDSYAIDIDADGDGWVRVTLPGAAGRVRVTYQAGMAAAWPALPDMIRQGIIRLAAHLYTHRDAADEGAPPMAVCALLRPWRRMRLS